MTAQEALVKLQDTPLTGKQLAECLDAIEAELAAKDELYALAKSTCAGMESALREKDARIAELEAQVARSGIGQINAALNEGDGSYRP